MCFSCYSLNHFTEQAEAKEKKRKLEEARETEVARKNAARERERKAVKLSCLDDDEEDDGADSQDDGEWQDTVKTKLTRMVKNDEVDTSMFGLVLILTSKFLMSSLLSKCSLKWLCCLT